MSGKSEALSSILCRAEVHRICSEHAPYTQLLQAGLFDNE